MGNQPNASWYAQTPKLIANLATRHFDSIIVIICVAFYIISIFVPSVLKEVFLSCSTSLLASLLFSFIYGRIVEKHQQTAINEELKNSVRMAIEDMTQKEQTHIQKIVDHTLERIEEVEKSSYHQISHHFGELLLIRTFSSTSAPNKAFNQLLADELSRSRSYFFKGVTGRYIATRLDRAQRRNLSCKVLLTDPHQEDLLKLYTTDRSGIAPSDDVMERRIEGIRREIFMAVVDLFDTAHRTGSIELKMYRGPVFYRTEIFDSSLIISYFTAEPTPYPTTYHYEKESFYYETYFIDFHQTFNLAQISLPLDAKTTEQELRNFLQSIGGNPDEIPQLRQEAKIFRTEFLTQLGWETHF